MNVPTLEESELIVNISSQKNEWSKLARIAKRKYPLSLTEKISLIRFLKVCLEDKLGRKINIGGDDDAYSASQNARRDAEKVAKRNRI